MPAETVPKVGGAMMAGGGTTPARVKMHEAAKLSYEKQHIASMCNLCRVFVVARS